MKKKLGGGGGFYTSPSIDGCFAFLPGTGVMGGEAPDDVIALSRADGWFFGHYMRGNNKKKKNIKQENKNQTK